MFYTVSRFGKTLEDPHRRKALQVQCMFKTFYSVISLNKTPENPHRRETFSLQSMFKRQASPFEPATGDFRRLSSYLSPATLNDFSRKNYNPFSMIMLKKKEEKKGNTDNFMSNSRYSPAYTYTYTYFSREFGQRHNVTKRETLINSTKCSALIRCNTVRQTLQHGFVNSVR